MARLEIEPAQPLESWVHATNEVPSSGLSRERAATETERAELARQLGILGVQRLVADYRIHAIAGGGWRLSGHVLADVSQACIVSLEPVAEAIDAPFDVEFWKERDEDAGEDDQSVLAGPDIEPLAGDQITVGRIVFETLSSSLDPYPRRSDASFDWQDKTADDPVKTSPFAVLSKLRDKT